MKKTLAISTFAFVVAACGGQQTNIDGGIDAAEKVACWGDARTDADRACSTAQDCAVVDHVSDCCGSLVEEGVRSDEVDALHNAETEANAGCSICKCPPNTTVDESGQSGGAYVASCDTGLCTAHAQ